mgnify:CR=1 FL=1
MFTQSNNAVVFEPVNEGDAEASEMVTRYVNHIINKDNNGVEIFHSCSGTLYVKK